MTDKAHASGMADIAGMANAPAIQTAEDTHSAIDLLTTNAPAKISRRALALGGPAAMAFGALGPVGVLGALGGAHTNAEAAVTMTDPAFETYFQNTFRPFARRALAYAMYVTNKKYFPSQLISSVAKWNEVYNPLTSTQKNAVLSRARGYLFNSTIPSWLMPRTIIPADVTAYLTWTTSKTNVQINALLQAQQYLWNNVNNFVRFAATPTIYQAFQTRVAAAELEDDRRRLFWGHAVTEDRVEEIPATSTSPKTYRVVFGNIRKPVERPDLIRVNEMPAALLYGPEYQRQSEIRHGINSRKLEVVPQTMSNGDIVNTTSTAFDLDDAQEDGIDWFANQDYLANGTNTTNMTFGNHSDMMKGIAKQLERGTGLVYESYVAAAYLLRAFSQGLIGIIRAQLFNGYFDLKALMTSVEGIIMEDGVIRRLPNAKRTLMANELKLLIGVVFMQLIAAAGMSSAMNKVPTGTPDAEAVNQGKRAFMAVSMTSQTVASLAAIGILYDVAITRVFNPTYYVRFVPAGFAAADCTAALFEMWRVIKAARSGGGWTATNVSGLLAACFRGAGGLYTALESAYKILHWDSTAGLVRWPPLQVTTITAGLSSGLSLIAFFFVVAGY